MAADNIFCQHPNWPGSFAAVPSVQAFNLPAGNNYLSMHELASYVMQQQQQGDIKYLLQPPVDVYLSQQQQLELLAYTVANNNMRPRDPTNAPLRKLSVHLICTYKHINEVPLSILLT